jgi:hypothetical protein
LTIVNISKVKPRENEREKERANNNNLCVYLNLVINHAPKTTQIVCNVGMNNIYMHEYEFDCNYFGGETQQQHTAGTILGNMNSNSKSLVGRYAKYGHDDLFKVEACWRVSVCVCTLNNRLMIVWNAVHVT